MPKIHILLVEDDADLGGLLSRYLGLQGMEVSLATDGETAMALLALNHFDIAILDVMLPATNGFTLAAQLKKHIPKLPFLFLTARREKEDVLRGLGMGADDYIIKPFDVDELILRLQNILRRSAVVAQPAEVISIGHFQFEPSQLRLSSASGSLLLTKKECGVMEALAREPGRIVSRQQILEQLWDNADYFSGRSLDVYIGRLRKMLEHDPQIRLESIRGSGFILHISPLGSE